MSRIRLAQIRFKKYNLIHDTLLKKRKEDNQAMTEAIEKLRSVDLPPQQREALGLKKDWKKNISKDFVCKVLEVKDQYHKALEELKKY
jgi:hypothetical protein